MALDATIEWDVRVGGSDNNGGGYDAISDGGTDYSQQNSPQLSVSDGAASGTTNLQSTTGGFTSAMVDNVLKITGGSLTAGHYQIVAFVDTNNVTLDRTPGTGSGSTVNVGGSLATPGYASGVMVASNSIWVQSGTYTVTSTTGGVSNGVVQLVAGAADNQLGHICGYNTTHGDEGTAPLIIAGAALGTCSLVNQANFNVVRNLHLDGNSRSAVEGINNNTTCNPSRLKFTNFGDFACRATNLSFSQFEDCGASLCHIVDGGQALSNYYLRCSPVRVTTGTIVGCVIDSGTGVGITTSGNGTSSIIKTIAYDCASHGFDMDGMRQTVAIGCLAYGNGGYGFYSNSPRGSALIDCAGGSNTSGNYTAANFGRVRNFSALTADPFIDAASSDFNINDTAGGGAVLRAVTFDITA